MLHPCHAARGTGSAHASHPPSLLPPARVERSERFDHTEYLDWYKTPGPSNWFRCWQLQGPVRTNRAWTIKARQHRWPRCGRMRVPSRGSRLRVVPHQRRPSSNHSLPSIRRETRQILPPLAVVESTKQRRATRQGAPPFRTDNEKKEEKNRGRGRKERDQHARKRRREKREKRNKQDKEKRKNNKESKKGGKKQKKRQRGKKNKKNREKK